RSWVMNEDAFLSVLHDNPSDEVTWLALSDWLDEDGQAQRAELVRLVRQPRGPPLTEEKRKRATLEKRLAQLLLSGVRPVVPEVTDAAGMRLALVPAGGFLMGSPERVKRQFSNETPHEAEITRPFYLGVFAVTQRQYEQVMGR